MAGRGFRERRFTAGGANTAHHYTSLARTVHPEGRRRHRRTAAGLAELRDQQLTPPPLLPPHAVRASLRAQGMCNFPQILHTLLAGRGLQVC